MDTHRTLLHSGVNSTITQLRQSFWIPSIRQLVRKLLNRCVTCKRVIGKPYAAPDPPPLPKVRVQDSPPFTVTGIDFTGSLNVKDRFGGIIKAYICLFTCAATRAIHMELLSNLSEETFLQAFRRFTSRKSLPRIVISDKASTFISASREIQQLCDSKKIQEAFSSHGIDWKFIPKRAPWFGGWLERLIALTKTALKKTLGRSLIDMDSLHTIITEIEKILNDRPLTYVSTDMNDNEPLTPAHLLYGRRVTSMPYPQPDIDISNFQSARNEDIVTRAKKQSDIIGQFWIQWKAEYLTQLREYHTKSGKNDNRIKVGDMVLVHDEKPRYKWKTAIVEELIYGNDRLVRSAVVRTANEVTNRPIVKLYPLEVCASLDDQQTEDTESTTSTRSVPVREASTRAKEKIKILTSNS